jgi:hypothetical protein
MYEDEEMRSMHKVLVKKAQGKRSHGRLDVDGRIISKWTGRCWIELAEDEVQWQAFVNIVMNFGVLKSRELIL